MRKALSLSSLIVTVFFVSCSIDIPKPKKENNIQFKKTQPRKVLSNTCNDCQKNKVIVKKLTYPCSKEIKVVHYLNGCSKSCGFPVTMRKISICSKGDL